MRSRMEEQGKKTDRGEGDKQEESQREEAANVDVDLPINVIATRQLK